MGSYADVWAALVFEKLVAVTWAAHQSAQGRLQGDTSGASMARLAACVGPALRRMHGAHRSSQHLQWRQFQEQLTQHVGVGRSVGRGRKQLIQHVGVGCLEAEERDLERGFGILQQAGSGLQGRLAFQG